MIAMTACGKKDSLLKGTILESSKVITYEDGIKTLEDCRKEEFDHYYSVITGEYIADNTCSKNCSDKNSSRYEIKTIESIVKYLTEEEIKKSVMSELQKEDISKIISSVLIEDQIEEEKQSVK